MRLRILLFSGILVLTSLVSKSQIVINEIQQSNLTTLQDNYGEYPDWFEIYNTSASSVNLANFQATDDLLKAEKWSFPNIDIGAGEFLTIFASGRDVVDRVDHWETVVAEDDNWSYVIPNATTSSEWRNPDFDDSSWLTSPGGFGYGDSDDETELPEGTQSVFLRKSFTITDTSEIVGGALHIDYDDSFVAYLNGTEIARVNLEGDYPDYDQEASAEREAEVIDGGDYEETILSLEEIQELILLGNNVLTIQAHNINDESSDLTARAFFSLALNNASTYWSNIPNFFTPEESQTYIHSNFSFNNGSEKLILINTGFVLENITLPNVSSDLSYGRTTDGTGTYKILSPSTPGESNSVSVAYDEVSESTPVFSLEAGFYNNEKTLSLFTSETGAEIRYTTDGSIPTATSELYGSPVAIENTQTIRARLFKSSTLYTETETNTYLIGTEDNPSLGVISISVNPDHFFGFEDGIYVEGGDASSSLPYYGANFWKDIEREIHLEYFTDNDVLAIEQDCGAKIFGGWSRAQDMKSLRLIARDEYGDGDFDYQFFEDKRTDSYKQIVLRNSGNDFNSAHFRDALNHEVIKKEGNHDRMAYKPVVVYINGEYWGIHNLRERMNHQYVEDNHGIDDDEIHLLENNPTDGEHAKKGDLAVFTEFRDFVLNNDMNSETNYDYVKANLDVENFIDYFVSQSYHTNWDATHNNARLWRPFDLSTGWRYLYYDTDFSHNLFSSYNTSPSVDELDRFIEDDRSSHTLILKQLLTSDEFKCHFIRRYADLMNSAYTIDNYSDVTDSIVNLLDPDIDKHHDRWGSSRASWEANIDEIKDFIEDRPEYAKEYLIEKFSLSGTHDITLNVSPAGAGQIKISTITPTSYPFEGFYFNGCPVTITAIPAAGYKFDYFTALEAFSGNNSSSSFTLTEDENDEITAFFSVDLNPAKIIFSEINYNSSDDSDAGDWVELFNEGIGSQDLSGWVFKDGNDFNEFIIPDGTSLDGGEYLVLSRDKAQFDSIHHISNVIGDFPFKLSNSGETIRLYDNFDNLKLSVTYDDKSPWSLVADGLGGTLEYQSLENEDYNSAENWLGGCLGGSPGMGLTPCPCESVSLGEDIFLCEDSSPEISANVQNSSTQFQWYLNDDKLSNDTLASITITTSGNYTVVSSTENCIDEDQITVSTAPSVNLGEDLFICETSSVDINTSLITGATYRWEKDGELVSEGVNMISITEEGTYEVAVNVGSCPVQTDEIIVSKDHITPIHSTICGNGSKTLSVSGTGNFSWFAEESGGTALSDGTFYITPFLTASTTYYVEDNNYFEETIQNDLSISSTVWNDDNYDERKLEFSINQEAYLNYVTVYTEPNTETITINISLESNDDIVKSVTVNAIPNSTQRIYLGVQLEVNDYIIDAEGTVGDLNYNGGGANYPIEGSNFDDQYISITGAQPSYAASLGWYPYFYNFELSNTAVQEECARTAVIASICDEPSVTVTSNLQNLTTGGTAEITVIATNEYSSITVDLGEGATPQYLTEPGIYNVQFNQRKDYSALINVTNLGNDVFTSTIEDLVSVCSVPYENSIDSDTLLCNVTETMTTVSYPNFDYEWSKDGTEIHTGMGLNSIEASDLGTYQVIISDPKNPTLCSNTSEEQILSVCAVGLDALLSDNISLSPNPATELVNIESNLEIISITVLSVSGKEEMKLNSVNSVDISDLEPGTYFIEINTKNGVISKRIIKE